MANKLLVVIACGMYLSLMGALLVYFGALIVDDFKDIGNSYIGEEWETTETQITIIKMEDSSFSTQKFRNNKVYRLRAYPVYEYSFEVNGEEYQGRGRYDDTHFLEQKDLDINSDDTYIVLYEPNNPKRNILRVERDLYKDHRLGLYFYLGIKFFLVFLIGIITIRGFIEIRDQL